MTQFTMIETDAGLNTYIQDLKDRGVTKLAMDFEGDQGRFRYKYSISLIQCYCGVKPVIVDVLALKHKSLLKPLLTDPDVIKVMFAGDNDIYMAQNVLGFTIVPMHDIAVAQKLLGKTINISEHIGIDKATKNRFQKANWLQRPLRDDLLQYAIGDVMNLIEVYDGLAAELMDKGLYDDFLEQCAAISAKDFKVDPWTQYRTKFPGYSRMDRLSRKKARIVWLCRELLAEHINCSSGYLLSRKKLAPIIREGKALDNILDALNEERRPKNHIKRELVQEMLIKARDMAEDYPL